MKPANDFALTDADAQCDSSDGSLLRRFQAGNDQAATDLYLRYARRVYQLAEASSGSDLRRRFDAEDIVQSVFSSFFRLARDGRYEVPDGEELWGLFLVMSLNKIRARGAFHRAACRDVHVTQPGDALAETAHDPRHDEMAILSLRMTIDEVLLGLPEIDRKIARLRIDGFEVAEIASLVARSRRTVERVLQEFRQQLRKSLDEEHGS